MRKVILGLFIFGIGILAFQSHFIRPEKAFLDALDNQQREKVFYLLSDVNREQWHFFPATMIPRQGLALKELTAPQKKLFFQLLESFLSQSGYEKALQIISLEDVLVELGQNVHLRDKENYFIAFYGNPETDKEWAWTFEGHHIFLHFVVADGQVGMTPRFFGANPAIVPSGSRKGERTLQKEEDLGLNLINSFSEEQKKVAIFQDQTYGEIITFVDQQVNPLTNQGIPMRDMNKIQQRNLIELIKVYLSSMPIHLAKKRMEKLMEEHWGFVTFGWAGATELGKPHYYRIQGKTFLIEFDNSQDGANHIHTVWREFQGDFGKDLLKDHYKQSHNHNH